jgi:hypothetical protein
MDGDSTAGNMTTNLQNMIGLNIHSSSLLMAASFQEGKPKDSGFNIVLPFGENGSILNSIPPYITLCDKYKINVAAVCPWETRFVFTSSILGPSNLGDYEKMFYNEGSTSFIIIK